VTTDNTNMTSEIDSDQAQLDAVQEAPGSQISTIDSTDEAWTEEIRTLKQLIVSQVAGLQSKVDRGLNGIRRDSEEAVRKQQEYALQQYLEEVPEEHRAAFQQMAQQNMELQQKVNQAQNETPVQEQAQSPDASSEWEQIYAIPRSMGLDPQSEGIDYAAFTDPGLNDTELGQR
jgi:hypothetical protein